VRCRRQDRQPDVSVCRLPSVTSSNAGLTESTSSPQRGSTRRRYAVGASRTSFARKLAVRGEARPIPAGPARRSASEGGWPGHPSCSATALAFREPFLLDERTYSVGPAGIITNASTTRNYNAMALRTYGRPAYRGPKAQSKYLERFGRPGGWKNVQCAAASALPLRRLHLGWSATYQRTGARPRRGGGHTT